MLKLQSLANACGGNQPFAHVIAHDVLPFDKAPVIAREYPELTKPGFFPVETLRCGESFGELCDDFLRPEVSRLLGEKLDLDLEGRPQMIVVRRWSAARDGRPHTDGADKVATALLYLNERWENSAGALRYLEGPDLDGPGGSPIPPTYGTLTAFARTEASWHGHPPFSGERRVIQVFWLRDAAALDRKTARHRRAHWLKSLWPAHR